MPESTVTVSEQQIESFRKNGYLVFESLTTQSEAATIRKICSRLFEEKVGREEGNQYDLAGTDGDDSPPYLPQIVNPINYDLQLQETLFRANSTVVGNRLLGLDTVFQGEHAILKPPVIGVSTPWHQDEAYWRADFEYDSLSIWLALQPTTIENGCLQFIPGSHKQDVYSHHPIGNNPQIHGLEVDEVDTSTAVTCPLSSGGATVHHCRTLHFSGPNFTDKTRLAYTHVWAAPYKKRPDRDFYWQRMRNTARDKRRQNVGTVSVSAGKIPK